MRRLAAAAWASVAVCVAATWVAWRASPAAWPHAGWALIAIALVFSPLLAAMWFAARRFLVREAPGGRRSRLAGLGWFFVAATPLAWVGSYYAHLYVKALSRESLVFGTPARLAATGALPYLDLEARLRYRRTAGRHATLYDDGAVNDPEALVLEMDRHLVAMARLLGQNDPPGGITWVRGSLLGTTGRAFLTTCVSDLEKGAARLTPLDRHESAHALITGLAGPDQDPPFLLIEGWAEYRSADRNQQIADLAQRRRAKEVYTLQELVEPPWYGRGWGPVYYQGGPLVHYLMERFGAVKFFELYSQTRLPTFNRDAHRILGETWSETEDAFWRWVEVEAALVSGSDGSEESPTKEGEANAIELAEGVDPVAWLEFVEAVRKAHSGAKPLPQGAYRIVTTVEGTGEYAKSSADHQSVEVVATDNGTWMIRSRDGADLFTADTPLDVASLSRAEGVTQGSINDFVARRDARRETQDMYRLYLSSPPNFPWRANAGEASGWRLDNLTRPDPGSDMPWVVEFTVRSPHRTGDAPDRVRCEVSPPYGWSQVYASGGRGDAVSWESKTRYEPFGESYLLVSTDGSSSDEKGIYRYSNRLTMLGPDDRERVRSEVERAIRGGTTPEYLAVRRTTLAVALGVPLASIALFTAGHLAASHLESARRKAAD